MMGSAKAAKQSSSNNSMARSGSYGESDSWNQSTGGGFNRSGSENWNQQGSSQTQDVWGGQAPYLQQLYQQAGQLAQGGGAMGNIANQAQGAWLQQLTPGGNPYFERAVQGSIDQATRGFTQGVLPALEARGVGVGQYGQPRDQLARGQAAGEFGAGLANSVAQQYASQYQGDQGRALQALGMGGQIQDMQSAGLRQGAQIIGGPTVLGQGSSFGTGYGSSFGDAQNWNQSTGGSSEWNRSSSTATSKGKSSGKEAGFGIGGK